MTAVREPAATAGQPQRPVVRTTLLHAAVLTVAITLAGSVLGLGRDLLLARFFGADGHTDAFLVAWMVPETAFPLLVEGAMAFLLVPLFSRALTGAGARDLVAATLPRITGVLVAASITVAVSAPLLVRLVAPGLAQPELAVTCTRLTAVTVLTFGLAGYLSAALRAHSVFGAPAAIHLAYNVGILGLMWTLHGRLGIVAAAAGVALGSVFMVLVQVPSFLRHIGVPRRLAPGAAAVALGAFVPLAVYTITRQSQVFVERFLGSSLPEGTISHLNYAQKVAQMPMLVALLVCTVTFPALARHVASGQAALARKRLEADLRTVTALIFVATAYLVVFAPVIIQVLLEHGRFGPDDTAATAAIMRVYAFGLLGHALVGALSRPFFTGERPNWYPAVAMAGGLVVTAVLAVMAVPHFGVAAIAAANGIGITTSAVLLLLGLRRRIVAVSLSTVGLTVLRLGGAAAGAGAIGWLARHAMSELPPVLIGTAGGIAVLLTFTLLAQVSGGVDIRELRHAR